MTGKTVGEQKHRTKVNWCYENDVIFVWLDWAALNRYIIQDGNTKRGETSRRNSVSNLLVEPVIKAYLDGWRYFEVPRPEGGGELIRRTEGTKYHPPRKVHFASDEI
jgi:hypothetical protein